MDHEIKKLKVVGGIGIIGRRLTGEDCLADVGAEFFEVGGNDSCI